MSQRNDVKQIWNMIVIFSHVTHVKIFFCTWIDNVRYNHKNYHTTFSVFKINSRQVLNLLKAVQPVLQ